MLRRTLVPWRRALVNSPNVDPFTALQHELNRTFEGFFNGDPALTLPEALTNLNPRLDISETDQEIHLTVELPGMTEQDVDVELLDDAIKVRGEKKDEREVKEHNFHRTERTFGSFERIIPLPKPVNRDGATATFKNGVLSVVLPKATPAVTHQKIAVQAG